MSEMPAFFKLLKDVQKVSAWALPTAAFAPIVASVAKLSPPWPETVALTTCTTLAMVLSLVFVFQLFRKYTRKRVNRIMVVSLLVLLPAALAYFSLSSLLVYTTSKTGERFVQGFECTQQARKVYPDSCPWLNVQELKEAQYEASLLWTAPSVMQARVSLLALWFVMFGATSVLLGTFVSFQSRGAGARPGSG